MRTLHLVTPTMRGSDVREAQTLLKKGGFYPEPIDGDFGSQTGTACVDAKKALGYPIKQCVPVFGPSIYAYLAGIKKVPRAYAVRAALRKQAVSKGSARVEAVLRLALSQLGTKESPPDSNIVKYAQWYGFVGAWCAAFVSWCNFFGIKGPFKYAFVPYVVGDARAHRNGLSIVGHPAQTTLELIVACFDWPGESPGVADHIGFTLPAPWLLKAFPQLYEKAVHDFGPLGPGDFWTVEGNTGIGNDSNGGEVMLRKRNASTVQAFVRIAV